ncbi:phage integrase family protein [Noviherbaspirillum galbum]|uniref:Core-binding (CB) domain-containing protein n=1 Tax=Noviherbaspirillum galbum TaxID=2709383 RepID=A0A6B3SWX4_9BURK|nr:phage integrase family protein [Noviherbaspirillum galbum]NEX63995.1 hypothetical protein [Noviherbaspirillum galbum]
MNNGTVLIRLGPNHFAFMRGYLEGLPLETLAERYLDAATDGQSGSRIAKASLKWIREQLNVAARRVGAHSAARVIFIDRDRFRLPPRKEALTLEEFREIRDPHELFSEAELIDLFHEEHGGHVQVDRRIARNDRLRRKQMEILQLLERALVSPPAMNDAVEGWLDPALSRRLQTAGIHSIKDLVDLINIRGARWWTKVPRFGAKAAAQVVTWLKTDTVGSALGIHGVQAQALMKPTQLRLTDKAMLRQREFGMVGLEYLRIPASLDGRDRRNRGQECALGEVSDLRAVELWLLDKAPDGNTWRSYRREAERFLLWMLLERGRSLSDATWEDVNEYNEFLRQVGRDGEILKGFRIAGQAWCAPRGTRRWSASWRPFEGALSESSRRQAMVILGVLGDWLVLKGYWAQNVFRAGAMVALAQQPNPSGLSTEHIALVLLYVEANLVGTQQVRARWLLLLGLLGLKAGDIALGEIVAREDSIAEGAFRLVVAMPDQGSKVVLLPRHAIPMLDDYALAVHGEFGKALTTRMPLMFRLQASTSLPETSRQKISLAGVSYLIKSLFEDTAEWLEVSVRSRIEPIKFDSTRGEEFCRHLRSANLHSFSRWRKSVGSSEKIWEAIEALYGAGGQNGF